MELIQTMEGDPFQPVYHTNKNQLTDELYQYFDKITEMHVRRITAH